MPTFGSLFAGIGGIDLGLERAGWECRWQVEWDPYCQHVLAHHWPDVPRYGDIAGVDWAAVPPVDLIAGGFPCQPWSMAGKRRGTEDDRWLWPEIERTIRELRPRYVLVENVPGLLAGRGGMGAVLGGLAALGYDAEWDVISAAAVGAPHLRERVWIVAYANSQEPESGPLGASLTARVGQGGFGRRRLGNGSGAALVADAHQPGSQGHGRLDRQWDGSGEWAAGESSGAVNDFWRVEPDVGRVAHGVPARVDRLRALGNAVVPQVVEAIGRRLLTLDQERAA